MPPVSINSKKRPPASTTVSTRSRVTPAVGSTMLIRRPASQLKSDDLPTFGRPTIATIGRAIAQLQANPGRKAGGVRAAIATPGLAAGVRRLPQRIPAVHDDRRAGDVAR